MKKLLVLLTVLALSMAALSTAVVSAKKGPGGDFVTGGGWIKSPSNTYKLPDQMMEHVVFFNGFEADIEGWFTPERVASGTDGITSASGDYHAEATTDFTRWGGYNSVFPSWGYLTALDVYLDVSGDFSNDTRFDWSSAISTPGGDHRRDFVFNGGFYNDADGSPGSGLSRFVFSAGNGAGRANSDPKNPGHDPIAITETGWYTLLHRFYDSGGGVLAVDLSIIDADGNTVHTWTLSDSDDIIGDTVGGNRYGWFANNEFPYLAIDNSERVEMTGPSVPVGGVTTPPGRLGTPSFWVGLAALLSLSVLAAGGIMWRRSTA